MKKILLSILVLVISTVSFSQLSLSGTVVDVNTKAPLAGASIITNGMNSPFITDGSGYFRLKLKESGVYDVEISKEGYSTIIESLMINESLGLQIKLTPKNGATQSTENVALQKKTKPTIHTSPSKVKSVERVKKEEYTEIVETPNTSSNSGIYNTFATVSGYIRDKETKAVLENCEISFKGLKRKYYSNAEGYFLAYIPKNDNYIINVKLKNYRQETNEIPVSEDLILDVLLGKNSTTLSNNSTNSIAIETTTDDVVISRTRALETTPTTFRTIDKEELTKNNLGKDLPYLLELTPSVVATSDGGSGTGYTSMRIRGSDITRINFTLNGFPVNDAESQGVFLVNTPDLASGIEDIQIQRGVGTSTNGSGAFGASVNINTNKLIKKPYAEFNNSIGSFATLKNTIKIGTGEIFDHFTFDGRFSHLATKGYIERSNAKMHAYSLTGTYYNKNSLIRFNVISGNEITHQAWNGVDLATMQNDRTYNSAGTDYGQNVTPHDNEIDKYRQDNYQMALTHHFGKHITANLGFHYTKGKGYFEQYKVKEDLLEYGIINPSGQTDLIRRRWLDNNFYGSIYSLNLKKGKINATLGGGWNQYDGDHYGEVIWAKDGSDLTKDEVYYFNNGLKTDFNSFLKAEYKLLKRLLVFGDIQYRRVSYSADGIDNDQKKIFEDADYNFINPKFGLTYIAGQKMKSQIYTSFAIANREPTRNDFIDNDIEPKDENMLDFELGFRHLDKKLSYSVNAFYMKYKNQLVLTGELNDVGSSVRANVDNSFRTGIETEVTYAPIKFIGVKATGTWSLNEIKEFSFLNTSGNIESHDNTKIAYSPTLTGNLTLFTKPFKGFEFALINKYVSEQYLDNTNDKTKILLPYFLNDARLSYVIKPKFMTEIEFVLKLNNIFNVKYASNGYVYYDTPYFYPQAGTNFEGAMNIKF